VSEEETKLRENGGFVSIEREEEELPAKPLRRNVKNENC
jgi:hypothetical protein